MLRLYSKADWRARGLTLIPLLSVIVSLGVTEATGQGSTSDLWQAARGGEVSQVQRLIAAGADVNAPDPRGATALHLAALDGHTEVVKALTAAGAEVNTPGPKGVTALAAAASLGHTEMVKLLIDAGAR